MKTFENYINDDFEKYIIDALDLHNEDVKIYFNFFTYVPIFFFKGDELLYYVRTDSKRGVYFNNKIFVDMGRYNRYPDFYDYAKELLNKHFYLFKNRNLEIERIIINYRLNDIIGI